MLWKRPPVDPALSSEAKGEIDYGQAPSPQILIDAAVGWTRHPGRMESGGRRLLPSGFVPTSGPAETVAWGWQECGIPW